MKLLRWTASQGLLSLLLIASAARVLYITWRPYVELTRIFYHDSLAALTPFHLFYQALFNGHLPLWTPELNGGQPLWPLVESLPALDPVAAIAWSIGYVLHLPAVSIFQITSLVWLALFAWGGVLCARQITRDWAPLLAVFVFLTAGPLLFAIPSQSYGFLLPFRYTPFLIYLIIRLQRNPTVSNAVVLGIVSFLSQAGYQTPYSLVFVGVFAIAYTVSNAAAVWPHVRSSWRQNLAEIRNRAFRIIGLYSIAAAIFLIGVLPTCVVGLEILTELVPIPRVYDPYSYQFSYPIFVLSGFDFFGGYKFWTGAAWYDWDLAHGSFTIGLGFWILIAISLVPGWLLRSSSGSSGKPGERPITRGADLYWPWIVALYTMFALGVSIKSNPEGDPSSLLMLRNWGFGLTCIIFCASQFVVYGYERCRAVGRPFQLLFLVLCFVALVRARHFHSDASGEVLAHSPRLHRESPDIPRTRALKFDSYGRWPYEGPSVLGEYAATLQPRLMPPYKALASDEKSISWFVGAWVVGTSHQFRLNSYEHVLQSVRGETDRDYIFGVSVPIVRAACWVVHAQSDQDALSQISRLARSPLSENAVVVSGGRIQSPSGIPVRGSACGTVIQAVKSAGGASVSVRVDMDRSGVLVYSDGTTSDWSVRVDGVAAELLRVNLIGKGVEVSAGRHDVEFVYAPWRYTVSFYIRLAVFAACGLGLIIKLMLDFAAFVGSWARYRTQGGSPDR